MSVYDEINKKGWSSAKPFPIGVVESRMKQYAKQNGIDLADGKMYMSAKGLFHARRDFKVNSGKALSEKDIADFPSSRFKMDLYFDGESFIYTDYKIKFVVSPNYKLKISRNNVQRVNFITAGIVGSSTDFNKYKKIERNRVARKQP